MRNDIPILRTSSKNCWARLRKFRVGRAVHIINDAKRHGGEADHYVAFWLQEGRGKVLKAMTLYEYDHGRAGRRGRRPHIVSAMPDDLACRCEA